MPRRSIFGEVKDTNKRGQCQIYSNIAEREYLRQAKDTKSRKQCKLICFLPRRNILGAAKVRFPFVSPRPAEDVPDAAGGAMPPSAWAAAGFRSSAAAEERIFRNCILAGLRPAGSHCKNNLILTSGSIPHLRLGVSCKERIYHFCHQKVAPKVSAEHLRRDRTEVLTERAQKIALLRRKRLHRFDCGGSAKSASGLCTRLLPVVLHTRSGRSNRRPI